MQLINYVQSGKSTGNGASTTITLNGVVAGDLIVVGMRVGNADGTTAMVNGNLTVTDNAAGGSNTYNHPASLFIANSNSGFNSSVGNQMLYAFNVKGGNLTLTATWPQAGSGFGVFAAEYSGVQNTADPLHLTATNDNGGITGTAVSVGALNPTGVELFVAEFCQSSVATTWSIGGGFTQRQDSQSDGNQDGAIGDKIAFGSQTASWTLNASAAWDAVMATFKAAPYPNPLNVMQAVKRASYY